MKILKELFSTRVERYPDKPMPTPKVEATTNTRPLAVTGATRFESGKRSPCPAAGRSARS